MAAVIGIFISIFAFIMLANAAPYLIGALLILLPSSLLLYGIKVAAGLQLDFGQVITFTLLLTVAFFMVFRMLFAVLGSESRTSPEERVGWLGFGLGGAILVVLLVMNYGFHHEFPSTFSNWVFAGDKATLPEEK